MDTLTPEVLAESSAAMWMDDVVEVCEPDEDRGFVHIAWPRFNDSLRIVVPTKALRPLTSLAADLIELAWRRR